MGYQIVLIMIIFAFQPLSDFIVEYNTIKLKRWFYKKFVYKSGEQEDELESVDFN